MRTIDCLHGTADSRTYKMLRRIYTLQCSYCRPHRGENVNYRDFRRRSWKEYRKRQYKNVG